MNLLKIKQFTARLSALMISVGLADAIIKYLNIHDPKLLFLLSSLFLAILFTFYLNLLFKGNDGRFEQEPGASLLAILGISIFLIKLLLIWHKPTWLTNINPNIILSGICILLLWVGGNLLVNYVRKERQKAAACPCSCGSCTCRL